MQITRSSLDTNPGPGDWFSGDVYIDAIASPVTWGEHVTDEQYNVTPAA